MFFVKDKNAAQFYERFQMRVAFSVALMSLAYASGAARVFLEAPVAGYLKSVQGILAVTAALLILPMVVKLTLLKRSDSAACQEPESFVADVFKRACVAAWSATFIALIFADPLVRKLGPGIDAGFIIQAALALMMVVFSGTFFYLSRDDSDLGDDDFADDEATS